MIRDPKGRYLPGHGREPGSGWPPPLDKLESGRWWRFCRYCERWKVLRAFVINRACRRGRASLCRACHRERNEARLEATG